MNTIPKFLPVIARYIAPTNSRGPRVKLTYPSLDDRDYATSRVRSWDYGVDSTTVIGQLERRLGACGITPVGIAETAGPDVIAFVRFDQAELLNKL